MNPCKDEPKEYIALNAKNRYRLEGFDQNGIGRNTIISIHLNDIQRVMVPRMTEWEEIHQRLADILEDIKEEGYKEKYKRRLGVLMQRCTVDSPYSAVKATNMLDDNCYLDIRRFLKEEGKWTNKLEELEEEMEKIALRFI